MKKITPNNKDIEHEIRAGFYMPATRSITLYRRAKRAAQDLASKRAKPSAKRATTSYSAILALGISAALLHAQAFA